MKRELVIVNLPTIRVDAELELVVRRNDSAGAVLEMQHVTTTEERQWSKHIGDIFTFYVAEFEVDYSVPHWEAKIYFLKDSAVDKNVGELIGRILLDQTSGTEPLRLISYPYLPYDSKLGEHNQSFAIDFGRVSDD